MHRKWHHCQPVTSVDSVVAHLEFLTGPLQDIFGMGYWNNVEVCKKKSCERIHELIGDPSQLQDPGNIEKELEERSVGLA